MIFASEDIRGQNLNFQNTFDRPCDKIRMEVQTEIFWKPNLNKISYYCLLLSNSKQSLLYCTLLELGTGPFHETRACATVDTIT